MKILNKAIIILFSTTFCYAKPMNFSISTKYNSNDIFKNTNRANIGFKFFIISFNVYFTQNLIDEKFFKNKIINNIKEIDTTKISIENKYFYNYDIFVRLRLLKIFYSIVFIGYKYYDVFKKDDILDISKDNRFYRSNSFFVNYDINFHKLGANSFIQYTNIKYNLKDNISYGIGFYYMPIKNTKISLNYSYSKDLEKNNYDDNIIIPYMNKNKKLLYLKYNNRIGNIEKQLLINEFHVITLGNVFNINNLTKFNVAVQLILDSNKKPSYAFKAGFIF